MATKQCVFDAMDIIFLLLVRIIFFKRFESLAKVLIAAEEIEQYVRIETSLTV